MKLFSIESTKKVVALLFFKQIQRRLQSFLVSIAMAERTKIRAYFIYSLALTGVVYTVLPKRFWKYRGWTAADAPYKSKLYEYLARSNVVQAIDGNSGLTIVFELLHKIGKNEKDPRNRNKTR